MGFQLAESLSKLQSTQLLLETSILLLHLFLTLIIWGRCTGPKFLAAESSIWLNLSSLYSVTQPLPILYYFPQPVATPGVGPQAGSLARQLSWPYLNYSFLFTNHLDINGNFSVTSCYPRLAPNVMLCQVSNPQIV